MTGVHVKQDAASIGQRPCLDCVDDWRSRLSGCRRFAFTTCCDVSSGDVYSKAALGRPLGGVVEFTEPVVLVLSSLAGGPKHGYALARDIESFAGIKLGPGTLYGALSRLEKHGWIEALPADDRRQPYQITSAGAAALAGHLTAMQRVTATGLSRLAMRPAR
jgi:DNA-binding MarR family transcriptional regulator